MRASRSVRARSRRQHAGYVRRPPETFTTRARATPTPEDHPCWVGRGGGWGGGEGHSGQGNGSSSPAHRRSPCGGECPPPDSLAWRAPRRPCTATAARARHSRGPAGSRMREGGLGGVPRSGGGGCGGGARSTGTQLPTPSSHAESKERHEKERITTRTRAQRGGGVGPRDLFPPVTGAKMTGRGSSWGQYLRAAAFWRQRS